MNTYKITSITRKDDTFTASVVIEKPVDANVVLNNRQRGAVSIASVNLAICGITSERINLTKEQAQLIKVTADIHDMVDHLDFGEKTDWSIFFKRDFEVGVA
jgi:hypothetical protein